MWHIVKPVCNIHLIRVTLISCMRNLRNVTLTLEEEVARWARIEAANEDVSVSRFLADILKQRMAAQEGYTKAMRRALARKPFLKTDGRYLSREEVHDRSRLR